MKNSIIRITLFILFLSPSQSYAIDKSVLIDLGYQYKLIEGTEAGGPDLGALAQFRVWKLVGGPSVIAGVGTKYSMIKYSVQDVDINHKNLALKMETGVEFLATETIMLQVTFAYEMGLTGSIAWDGRGASAKKEITRYRRRDHEWRGLYALNPLMNAGLGLGWYSGVVEAKDLPQELNYNGWALRLLYEYKI